MNRKISDYLNFCYGGLRTFMVILCFLVISCSATKKNNQDENKQVQPEMKYQKIQDKNRSKNDDNNQQGKSNKVNNQQQKSRQPSVQQQTNDGIYSSDIKNARTSREKAAQTEDKLEASLRNFDEMLLKKNDELSKMSRRQGESEGGGNENQGGTESGLGEQNGGSVSTSRGSGQSITGIKSQDKKFDNDDVIARQIREAAEQETDPELKKKLWVEYEKYKTGK